MNKKTLGIAAVIASCFAAMFALTGCEPLGIELTSQGIRANSNTLIICTVILIVVIVVVQRLLER